jgi:NAD(P)-dependent dehydrogenase (short-subunit alcohol dehydrogenase family)
MSAKPKVLQHRSALITGGSRGLGFEIARHYLEAGASLMICARNEEVLEQSASELKQWAGPGQSVAARRADVSDPEDAAWLVDEAYLEFGRLDILVNNAGVAGPSGTLESVDWEAWTRALKINLLGSVLMCRAVLPHFKRAKRGKIIQLSGGGATNPLPNLSAYAASKAAVVRFVETLAEETREDRIDVNALAPGSLDTRMLDEFIAAGPDRIGRAFHERSVKLKQEGGVPLAKGARLAVFLGSALSDGITGKLLSAVWDPWETLIHHREDLNATDVYTLRRILPADRGFTWGEGD